MGNGDRNSVVKHVVYGLLTRYVRFPATNLPPGFGVSENRGVWSETKARYMYKHDNIT